jgi:hypothetical protein
MRSLQKRIGPGELILTATAVKRSGMAKKIIAIIDPRKSMARFIYHHRQHKLNQQHKKLAAAN